MDLISIRKGFVMKLFILVYLGMVFALCAPRYANAEGTDFSVEINQESYYGYENAQAQWWTCSGECKGVTETIRICAPHYSQHMGYYSICAKCGRMYTPEYEDCKETMRCTATHEACVP